MKNIKKSSIFCMLILAFLFYGFSGYELDKKFETTNISITLDTENANNKDVKSIINNSSKENNVGLVVGKTKMINKKIEKSFYISENNQVWKDIKRTKNVVPKNNEYFSTRKSKDKNQIGYLKVATLFNEYKAYSIDKLHGNDLSDTMIYLNGTSENIKNFEKDLEKQSIVVKKYPIPGFGINSMSYMVVFYYLFIIIMLLIMFILNNRKYSNIKLMNGYAKKNIYQDTLKKLVKTLLESLLIVGSISFVALLCFDFYASVNLLLNIMLKLSLLMILVVIIYIILEFLFGVKNISVESLKGKNQKKILFIISTVFKLIFLYLLIQISLESLNSFETAKKELDKIPIGDTANNYVTLYSGVSPYEEYEKAENFEKLYGDLNKEKEIILFDTVNYRNFSKDMKTPCQANSSYCYATVNKNYLKKSKLEIVSGEVSQNKINFFISNKFAEKQKEIVKKTKEKAYIDEDVNIVIYNGNKKFKSYDPFTSEYITNPTFIYNPSNEIYDPNKNIVETNSIAKFLNKMIYIPTKTNDPYKELLPFFKKSELDDVITSVDSISDYYLAIYLNDKISVEILLFSFLIELIIIIMIIVNSIIIYIDLKLKNNIIKKLNGYSIEQIFSNYFIIIIIEYITLIILMSDPLAKLIVVTLYMLEMIISYIILNNVLNKKLLGLLKEKNE